MKFKPLSPGVGRAMLGSKRLSHGGLLVTGGSQPGRWEKLFYSIVVVEVEDWLADLEIQFCGAGRRDDTTGPSIWRDSESSSQVDAFLTQPNVTSNLLRVWVFCGSGLRPAETGRETKTSQKQQNQTCAQLPNLATVTEPDQWPGPREGHHSRWCHRCQVTQEKAWLENGPESRMTIMEQLLGLPESSWTGALASEKSEFGSLLFVFLSWPELFGCYFTWFSQWPRWGSTWNVKVTARTGTQCLPIPQRGLFPLNPVLHISLLDYRRKFSQRRWPREKRNHFQKGRFSENVHDHCCQRGTAAWWFSF